MCYSFPMRGTKSFQRERLRPEEYLLYGWEALSWRKILRIRNPWIK